jgi:hypothetical protein
VGSTPLAQQLDPEDYREGLQAYPTKQEQSGNIADL